MAHPPELTLEEYLDIRRIRELQDEKMINEWLKEQLKAPWRVENYQTTKLKVKGAAA